MGSARFLMHTAPSQWLFPGQMFELYEGFNLTAVVEILSD
jgi:hypothetical protein